jgi:hypothetical protein
MGPKDMAARIGEICPPPEKDNVESTPQPEPEIDYSATQMVKITNNDEERREAKRQPSSYPENRDIKEWHTVDTWPDQKY